ncbi:SWIB/MDM2 domain [Sesbania bispinosa]|nr:SWIB/MDM2 domain [Sesbania bispinosa]
MRRKAMQRENDGVAYQYDKERGFWLWRHLFRFSKHESRSPYESLCVRATLEFPPSSFSFSLDLKSQARPRPHPQARFHHRTDQPPLCFPATTPSASAAATSAEALTSPSTTPTTTPTSSSQGPFTLHQNPNFHPAPVTSAFQTFPSNHAPPLKPDPAAAADAARTEAPPVSSNEPPKDSTQTKAKRRGGPGGLNKLCGVSPELQVIVGQPALPRTEIVKQLWAYIRKNNLQDPSNKRKIICNDELRVVFETDCTDMFKMNKLLAKHIIPLEPTKQPVPKKQKVDVELETKSAEPAPSVIISDALANFFGITGREMLQSEVLRRIWEYIKVNQLEDPVNPMAIVCDAKLQEIFGCESISALGIPEVLGPSSYF